MRPGRQHHQGLRARAGAYALCLAEHASTHPDVFVDQVGAEAAVTAWRRHFIATKASPSTVNQALAAVDLLYEVGAGLRLKVDRARVPRPRRALTRSHGRSRGRSSGPPTAAMVPVLLYTEPGRHERPPRP